jgi:hypothetical protein
VGRSLRADGCPKKSIIAAQRSYARSPRNTVKSGEDLLDSGNIIRQQVEKAIQHLLSEQNRDKYSVTYGCFDRRYWGWKIADYPESTFQRNVYPLAWFLTYADQNQTGIREVLKELVMAGLDFSTQLQRRNGSFDQAFPYEHSFGATAFLLHPLLKSYQIIEKCCSSKLSEKIKLCLCKASEFLCQHEETHAYISNHLAGAVLSLLSSADLFGKPKYERRALDLLDNILAHQSSEGWFYEYGGADPGYQTLCIHYLAQIYKLKPDANLRASLEKALFFLSWFVHPDGTFGGEYGSRRTSIYYPGGIALLSNEFPLARSISRFMAKAISENKTVTLEDIDSGNIAALLSSYILMLDAVLMDDQPHFPLLPCEKDNIREHFPRAGLHIHGTKHYYSIVGVSNGGVLKVFDKRIRKIIWNDSGYVGETRKGNYITTQITDLSRAFRVTANEIEICSPFYKMQQPIPTPFRFVLLRLLNLTLMRNIWICNYIKGVLVKLLISGTKTVPLHLIRRIRFEHDKVVVNDVLTLENGTLGVKWLESGQPFVAIHMASSRYFENIPTALSGLIAQKVDVGELQRTGEIQIEVSV